MVKGGVIDGSKSLLGSFVISKQGRDIGRAYVIIEVLDDSFVLVADGKVRKLIKPKKKRVKHLKVFNRIDTISDKLADSKKIFDSELYSVINAMSLEIAKENK